jgi:adenylate cyclase class 1
MTPNARAAHDAAVSLRRLAVGFKPDSLDEMLRLTEPLTRALERDPRDPDALHAGAEAACLLAGACASLAGNPPAAQAGIKALLGLGRPGWLAAADFLQARRIAVEHLSALVESLPPRERLFLLHELLRRHWRLDKQLLAWVREPLEGVDRLSPHKILDFLETLDLLGDTPAFPLRETLLRGPLRSWLAHSLEEPLVEIDLLRTARAVRGLGDPELSRGLARHVAARPGSASAAVMEVLSRCLEAGGEALVQAVQAVLKDARNGRVAHCMDILIGVDWPKTGQALALFHRKEPSMRRALTARAATLPESAFAQFLGAFSAQGRPAVEAEALAAIARADTDFLRRCLLAEAGPAGLPEALERYLERMTERSAPLSRVVTQEPEDPATKKKGLFSKLMGGKRAGLSEVLAYPRPVQSADFSGAVLTGSVVEERSFSEVNLAGAAFERMDFRKCRFARVDLAGAVLQRVRFADCEFVDVRFEGARLAECVFERSGLEGCVFSGAVLENGGMSDSRLTRCLFSEARVSGWSLSRCAGVRLCLSGMQLQQAAFAAVSLEACDFSLAELDSCRFEGLDLCDCQFTAARIRDCSFVECRTLDCLFAGCRLTDSDVLEPALLQARADTLRQRLKEAESAKIELPPAEGSALYGPALRRWVRQWAMGRFERRMLAHNARRLELARRRMTPGQADFFRLLPHLLDSRLFETRENIENVPPCRVAGYSPDLETLRLAAEHFPGVAPPPAEAAPVSIEAVYTIGSVGSIAQTATSDMDVWVCYDPQGVGPAEDARLRRKLEQMAAWAQSRFGAEVHFFLMTLPEVRANDFGLSDKESAGSAQALLLKEEFYRTALRVAGKELLWWLTPPGADEAAWEEFRNSARTSPLLGETRVTDLGRPGRVPAEEFFGASLWQIVKGLHSPYKSVLKLGLLEKYAGQDAGDGLLLCDQIKDAVTRRLSEARLADPYTVLFRNLRDYYQGVGDADAVGLLTDAFTLKAGIADFDHTFGFPSAPEELSFLAFLLGDRNVTREAAQGLDRSWSFARAMKTGAAVSRFLINTYQRIQSRLEEAGSRGGVRISPEDLTRLGRQIQANFAPRRHKVERVPFLDLSAHYFPEFYFEAEKAPGKRPVWLVRGQESGRGKVSSKGMQVLRKDTDPAMLLTWLVVNGIYSPATHVHGERSVAPMAVEDLKKILQTLHEFFPLDQVFEVDMEETLRPERVTRAFFLPNLGVPHDIQKVAVVSIVYATNWGELFCRSVPNPDAKLLKQASAFLHDILPQATPEPPQMGLYLPKKSQCPRIRLL